MPRKLEPAKAKAKPAGSAIRSWDCKACHLRDAVTPDGLCKVCADAVAREKKKAAKDLLKVETVLDLKRVVATPPEVKRELEAVADAIPPAQQEEIEKAHVSSVAAIKRWRREPWTFVREVFKVTPDAWQDDALHALTESGFVKFCMKACKGPGKSCLMAWVIWWFMVCFSHAKVIVTSITEANLNDNLWAELAKWRLKSTMLIEMFEYQASSIYSKDYPDTWFVSPRTWPKDADNNRQAQTLAGLHAQNTLMMIDEAGGVPTPVLVAGLAHHNTADPSEKALEAHLTFIAGNPDDTDTCLGWACTEDAAHWHVTEITGDPDDPKRSPRIDIEEARRMIKTFGRDNPWVMVNILGKFPPVGSNKLIGSDQVRAAMKVITPRSTWASHPRVMTLDVARSTGRDRSVLGRKQGSVVFPFKVYRLDDAHELASQVAFEYGRWPGVVGIIVDAVGIGGPVADHLRALGLNVIMFHGGAPARDSIRFADMRTETWWQATTALKGVKGGPPEIALPSGALELVSELPAPLLQWNRKGQMKLESKEDMLKRGISSPDVADALTMFWAEPSLGMIHTNVPASTVRSVQDARGGGKVETEYDPFAAEA